MLDVNYTNLRDNMESYNNLMENVYVMGNKANYDWLMESKAQLEKGNVSLHNLIEVELDE